MNKELFTKKFDKSLVIKDISYEEEDKITITHDDGVIIIATDHDNDCCEHVYSDTSVMKYFKDALIGTKIGELTIKGVEDMGFLLCIKYSWNMESKIFIACYNVQNGYYSDNLSLEITIDEIKTTVDISEFVDDNID